MLSQDSAARGAAADANRVPPGVPPGAPRGPSRPRHPRRNLAVVSALILSLLASIWVFSTTGRSTSRPPSSVGAVPGSEAGPTAGRPPSKEAFGLYPGDGTAASEVTQFAAESKRLGRSIPYVVIMTDTRSPSAFRGSAFGHFVQAGGWSSLGADRPTVVVSVPLGFGAFTPTGDEAPIQLGMAARGDYDSDYRYLAESMVAAGYGDDIIRLGWEFDGSWMPWSAQASPDLFVAAFRHVHDVFASVSSKFRFDWTSAAGYERPPSGGSYHWQGAVDWSLSYPGDKYVDIVGQDVYDEALARPYNPKMGTWVDPTAVWSYESTPLAVQRDFAIAHGKQVSYPEWGLSGGTQDARDQGGDNPTFIRGMAAWFASLPKTGAGSLAYQAYFEGSGSEGGVHAIEEFPKSYAVFQQTFGG
jgi:hypothetical protein